MTKKIITSHGNLKNLKFSKIEGTGNNKVKLIDIFEHILLEPEIYIESKGVPKKIKISTLDMLIEYFVISEDYDKCHKLLMIKNKI